MALKHKIRIFAIVAIVILTLCGLLIYTRIDAKDWAAWVQAVGSIAAIVFAIALTWYQGEASIERERIKEYEEVTGLLLSIRDELCVNIQMAQQMVGDKLEETEAGTAFYYIFPVQEDPFNIYNSLAGRLPLIKDEVLRLQIIKTYGIAKGAIGTFRKNNEMLLQYEAACRLRKKSGSAIDQLDVNTIDAQLANYGDGVRLHYARVKKEIDTLMSLLRNRDL
ncbi:hypothetical protein O3297_09275 [Janthinobacterium sp. SUN128]|uniref:hypothetical protein n=1 Tax=Janthinobacterium sp. SUN128 TaxID=3014790 RepID=UPI00271421FD|nr:hypothetical protein [Janthinobacterium sp. SUN128]MDO8033606.1 hypothetical protein [Janthinobacterium sp. SUN128]